MNLIDATTRARSFIVEARDLLDGDLAWLDWTQGFIAVVWRAIEELAAASVRPADVAAPVESSLEGLREALTSAEQMLSRAEADEEGWRLISQVDSAAGPAAARTGEAYALLQGIVAAAVAIRDSS